MYATIQKWGNSHGLRIPKTLLDAFYGKPVDQIPRLDAQEIDWGGARGEERW